MSRMNHRWHAAAYDLFMGLGRRRMDELRRATAGRAGGRVLEIGCGTGLNLAYYDWDQVESLDATEPDLFMLKRARKKAGDLPLAIQQRLRLHQAPAERLPFADSSFDTVVASLVLCTVSDPAAAAAETKRLLRPGGTLYFIEHVRGEGATATAQRLLQPAWGWAAAGCHLDRDSELTLAGAGMRVRVQERFRLGPLLPAILGTATRP